MTPPKSPRAATHPSLSTAIRDLFGLLDYVHGPARRRLYWAILATTLAAVADIASLILLQRAAMALTGLATGTGALSSTGPIAFLCATLAGSALRLWAQRLTTAAQYGITEALTTTAFRTLQYQSYADYIAHGASEGFAAMERLQIVCFNALAPFVSGIAALITTIVVIATVAALHPFVIVPIAFAGLAAGAGMRLIRRREASASGTSHLARMRGTLLLEARTAFRDIHLVNGQARMTGDFARVEHRLRHRQARIALGGQSARYPFEIVVIGAVIGFLLLVPASTAAALRAIPTLGIFALAALRLMPSLGMLRSAAHLIGQHGDVIADALALLRRQAAPDTRTPETLVFERDIVLRGVGVVRPDRLPILDGLDLRIDRGARIGIVGTSGSGKSTLLDLICGIVMPTSGTVLIDGVPLDPAHGPGWRDRIGVVSQNPILLGTTIGDIVSYPQSPEDTDGPRFDAAVALAGVAAMAEGFPDGLGTATGETLSRLSGGQRQRLALAHALYRAHDLLLLDEATGQLDADSERAVVTAIDSLPPAITVIVVTHRPALLACCDTLYTLADGRLELATPTPDEATSAARTPTS